MGDPDTWWLNLTNAALGGGVVLCILAVAASVIFNALRRPSAPVPKRKAVRI